MFDSNYKMSIYTKIFNKTTLIKLYNADGHWLRGPPRRDS